MAEVVNLRRARKRKRRDDEARTAAAKRVLYGQRAGEKAKSRVERELGEKRLDGHRREVPSDPKAGGTD